MLLVLQIIFSPILKKIKKTSNIRSAGADNESGGVFSLPEVFMKKIFFSFLALCLLIFGGIASVYASKCQVEVGNDDIASGEGHRSLRFYLESYIYIPGTGSQNSSADCSDDDDSYSGANQLISFKDSVTTVTLDAKEDSEYVPLRLNTLKDFVIGDSDQTVMIKARNLASGTSPFECVDGSKSVYLRNIILETNGITDIFAAETCLKSTDTVFVCNGEIDTSKEVGADGWCSGETWPAPEEEDDDDDDDDTGPSFDPSNLTIASPMPFFCKDEDGDTYYKMGIPIHFMSGSFEWNDAYEPCDPEWKKGDCDDSSDTTYPSATELDDDVDNNCDGQIDEGLCVPSDEICDGLDNDCDGTTDEDGVCNFCTDYDEDGYPVASDLCTATEYDCVDNNAEISPAATDICGDGIDQNCSGSDCSDEVCGDSLDNDENGLADCSDTVCVTYSSCNNLPSEVICNDGLDDEGDGFADCLDADCAQLGVCTGELETLCGDNLDNDGDGIIDCEDTDCYNVVFNPETGEACPSGEIITETGSSSGCGCYLGTTSGPVGGNFSAVVLWCVGVVVSFGFRYARRRG